VTNLQVWTVLVRTKIAHKERHAVKNQATSQWSEVAAAISVFKINLN